MRKEENGYDKIAAFLVVYVGGCLLLKAKSETTKQKKKKMEKTMNFA